jgi:hypothetical protein
MNPDKWPIYYMPDGAGGWMRTSPELHNKFIREANARSGQKLRRTVQLIKYWRECRSPRIPISSFYLDLLIAEQRICEGAKSYSQCLAEAFALLARYRCQAYTDPLGVAEVIDAVKTGGQRDAALRSVSYAHDHASRALMAELRGNHLEACRQWDIVFNGQFPY